MNLNKIDARSNIEIFYSLLFVMDPEETVRDVNVTVGGLNQSSGTTTHFSRFRKISSSKPLIRNTKVVDSRI